MTIDKRTFKICEAVRLGLVCYYMAPKDRRSLTQEDIEFAHKLLPTLPDRWWEEQQEWQVFGKRKSER